jgi:Uma2 family endonuclease
MSIAIPETAFDNDLLGIEPTRIVLRPLLNLDDDQFLQLCAQNPEQPFEQTAQGEVIIVAPTGMFSGSLENKILYQLTHWNEQHQRGVVFSSSALIRLPKGSIRSPDATWIELSRWQSLTEQQQKKLGPICPNFVIELRSETDRVKTLQKKLEEYIDNGVELGWIIDPIMLQVHIYAQGKPLQVLDKPTTVTGTGSVAGFVLDLKGIFPASE